MPGPLYGPGDVDQPREMGFEVIDGDELVTLTPARYGERARARAGDGPVYMSFDIDVLDPAFAPGTGTPEVAGLSRARRWASCGRWPASPSRALIW